MYVCPGPSSGLHSPVPKVTGTYFLQSLLILCHYGLLGLRRYRAEYSDHVHAWTSPEVQNGSSLRVEAGHLRFRCRAQLLHCALLLVPDCSDSLRHVPHNRSYLLLPERPIRIHD
jgi:hypothetical protein